MGTPVLAHLAGSMTRDSISYAFRIASQASATICGFRTHDHGVRAVSLERPTDESESRPIRANLSDHPPDQRDQTVNRPEDHQQDKFYTGVTCPERQRQSGSYGNG
jgi:hypothetical protein